MKLTDIKMSQLAVACRPQNVSQLAALKALEYLGAYFLFFAGDTKSPYKDFLYNAIPFFAAFVCLDLFQYFGVSNISQIFLTDIEMSLFFAMKVIEYLVAYFLFFAGDTKSPYKDFLYKAIPLFATIVCQDLFRHFGVFNLFKKFYSKNKVIQGWFCKTSSTEQSTSESPRKVVADDLICPITYDLPFDPVMAEDGRAYERAAIEEYFATRDQHEVKSLITNVPMGTRLVAAPQVKSLIETLVEQGVIVGDLASKWKEKELQKKHLEDVLKRAQDGDVNAMTNVGHYYLCGGYGFQVDKKKAYSWFDRADAAGDTLGTAYKGYMLVHGFGVEKNHTMGATCLRMAAGNGSDYAAYYLGYCMANAKYGFPLDKSEAVYWLKKSLSGDCANTDLRETHKSRARELLEELTSN